MSVTLSIPTFSSSNLLEKTNLTSDVAIGAIASPVANAQGYIIADYVLLGTAGSETAEIVTVSGAPSAVSLPISTTTLKHLSSDPVTRLYGNKIKIYRAPNVDGNLPADNTYTAIATISVEADQVNVAYTDSAGSNAYWYRYTYYNSTSLAETSLTDSIPSRGDAQHYASLEDIRAEAGFAKSSFIKDQTISDKRDAAEAEINAALNGFYTVPFVDPVNPLISDITKRLAAGLLLLEQYGQFDTLNTQNGKSKVDAARADIARLQGGSLTLTDANGGSLAASSAGGFSGYPNSTDDGLDENSQGDFAFNRGMIY